MTKTVTLTEASERLGVHYMTAYRYVRTGRLAADKVSGQWHVLLEDLAAVQPGRTTDARKTVLPGQITERLLAGDENGTFQALEAAMGGGANVEEIYLDILAPALTEIGQRWHDGKISIADEHLATAAAMRVVARLGSRIASRPGRTRGTIVLATVAHDHHFLPTSMMRDLLRYRSFDVLDLGGNTPAESIVDQLTNTPDLVAVGLSASTTEANEATAEAIAKIRSSMAHVPIVVGGGAWRSAEEITALGDCIPSTSARDALGIFDRLHEERKAG